MVARRGITHVACSTCRNQTAAVPLRDSSRTKMWDRVGRARSGGGSRASGSARSAIPLPAARFRQPWREVFAELLERTAHACLHALYRDTQQGGNLVVGEPARAAHLEYLALWT